MHSNVMRSTMRLAVALVKLFGLGPAELNVLSAQNCELRVGNGVTLWLAYDHSFCDGNGRTARALLSWAMLHQGYWLFEFISISSAGAHNPVQNDRSRFNYNQRQVMVQGRGVGTPQAVRLPAELLERIDLYAARLGGELHLSVSRSDALRRLLTLALEDAEDTAEAEAILRTNEPRVSWEE